MCMVTVAVSKDFGVIAADSARDENGSLSYEFPKLKFLGGRYLVTAIGSPLFIARLDYNKFKEDMGSLSVYMEGYFKEIQPSAENAAKKLNLDPAYQKPTICAFVLGVHGGKPTLAMFNSYLNFKPKYLFSDGKIKFATIHYGGDVTGKKKIFEDTTEYMEKRFHKMEKKGVPVTPGSVGEILVRGIYKKADLEMELPPHKKYSGGVPTVAFIQSDGSAFPLSNVILQ